MEQLDQWKKQLPEYSNLHVIFAEYDEEKSEEICLFIQVEEWWVLWVCGLARCARSCMGPSRIVNKV